MVTKSFGFSIVKYVYYKIAWRPDGGFLVQLVLRKGTYHLTIHLAWVRIGDYRTEEQRERDIARSQQWCQDHYQQYRAGIKKWAQTDYAKAYHRKRNQHLRHQALKLVGGPECRLKDTTCKGRLQIDHINGDGREDREIYGAGNAFYFALVSGHRNTEGLRVLCQSHNLREAQRAKVGVSE